ncbi:MAG: CrcB family protein [Rhodobacteraceae bacterium]|nr:CrcB family protein [Paracoccaceae bacterium]
MMPTLLQVALGGAIGASLRWAVGLTFLGQGWQGFPLAVLVVNVLGSFIMGVCFVALSERELMHVAPFLMVGVLGGFTTFSAFSLETLVLIERGDWGMALGYVALSVALSVGGLVAGVAMTRAVLA